jgi:hypothetical protein
VAAEDLADTLIRVVEDAGLRKILAEAMAARLSHYNAGADGGAARRVAAVMLEALGVADQRGKEIHVQGRKPGAGQEEALCLAQPGR